MIIMPIYYGRHTYWGDLPDLNWKYMTGAWMAMVLAAALPVVYVQYKHNQVMDRLAARHHERMIPICLKYDGYKRQPYFYYNEKASLDCTKITGGSHGH